MSRPISPRDLRGWRVPRAKTLSRQVYELMVMGYSRKEIARALHKKRSNIGVLMFKIRHPDVWQGRQLVWKKSPSGRLSRGPGVTETRRIRQAKVIAQINEMTKRYKEKRNGQESE